MKIVVPNRFDVIRLLKDDAESQTFLANDNLLGRTDVVVKVFPKRYFDPASVSLTQRMSWFSGVRHSNLAPILDVSTTPKGDLYYIRDYLGTPEFFSMDNLTAIKALTSAVLFLQSHDQVHGAIKPSNIFLKDHLLKLIDPRFTTAEPKLTEENIRYSAPEVLRGAAPDLRSDLYSLGAILYRVLTQRNLFEDPNLTHLRTKHLWASPLPIGNVIDVPKIVTDLVFQLLDKDTNKRTVAFQSLIREVEIVGEPAMKAPFIGRDALLEQTMNVIQQARPGLQVLLFEGIPGIGKSRFIEELRIHCGLGGLRFLKCDSAAESNHELFSDAILKFLKNIKPSCDSMLSDGSQDGTQRPSNQETLFSEFISSLAEISGSVRLILAIENIDRADTGTIRFIDRISFRAAELSLTLILTQRTTLSETKLAPILQRLPDRLRRLQIPLLTPTESLQLMRYLARCTENDRPQQHFSSRNPLFIEEATSAGVGCKRQKEALKWMLAQIPKNCRRLADALSIAQKPVCLDMLKKILPDILPALEIQVNNLEQIGVIERQANAIRIACSEMTALLYRTLSRNQRMELAKTMFSVFSETKSETEDLAHYALEARLFKESGALYQHLADRAFDLKNYKEAAAHYVRLEESERILSPDRRYKQAVCLFNTGKPFKGNVILQGLLAADGVRENPELLSKVYRRLALAFHKTSADERVRLCHLALQCLPPNSPQMCTRYVDLADNLIRAGNLSAAAAALEAAKQYATSKNDLTILAIQQSALASNMGDFKNASNILLAMNINSQDGQFFNNLALCYEHLGDLKRALEFQSKAHDFTQAAGMVYRRLLTLGNLTSINTKLGNMQTAKQLLENAFSIVAQTQKKERLLDEAKFLSMYCDAAMHNIHRGNYREAEQCLKCVLHTDGLWQIDQIFCETVRCYFYLSMGRPTVVREILKKLNEMQGSKTAFFQVERSLIEAALPDIPKSEKLRLLKEALEHTYQLETVYQECQVLNELAAVLISVDEKQKALEYANSAIRLAQKEGYRLLRTRALLLSGVASEKHRGKEQKLLAALQNASEMGLQELVAESAFYLGALHLESQNIVMAREYLSRSVSITDKLAGDAPAQFRATYRAVPWRRKVHKELERCQLAIQQQSVSNIFVGVDAPQTDRYFKAAYNFALSGASTKSTEGLLTQIEHTLETSITRSCVILLKDTKNPFVRGLRVKVSDDLLERVRAVATMARTRIYLGAPDMTRPKETVVWVPLQSETHQGGIYMVCRQNEPALTEKEMELLAIIGTIGNGALRTLGTNQASAHENEQLAEFHGMVGASKVMRDVYSHVEIAAKNTATVLIEGESGTGKELVAKAIHAAGPRAKEPFIAVDCGAIPESLIEAELFGAKRGSYTGALADRAGLFEAAHKGTIFLDEISNTTPVLQGKLLRIIQEREVRRIGETKDRPVDVRIIVATNRNLEELVAEGRFRKDLLYRLKVLYIKVPPLRNRREDIPMIANAFLQKLNADNKLRKYCAPGVLDHLSAQNFPGNVRELQNAIERAYFLSKGSVINEIQLEDQKLTHQDEAQLWFKDLIEGRKDFWQTVHDSYKRRDITRDKVLALVDLGLRSTGGSYKSLALKFHLKRNEYRRFMDFLRRNKCLLDFRPYRKAAATEL